MSAVTEARAKVLIDVAQLSALLKREVGNVVVLHVGAKVGDEGIAGAIPVSLGDFAGTGGGTQGERPLPDIETLQVAARKWGINAQSHVILYDDKGGLQAARGWWVLRWAGVDGARLLDGGLEAWRSSGHIVATLRDYSKSGNVELIADNLPQIDADSSAQLAHEGRLLDARPVKAFVGDPTTGSGGHIPGAISAPASGNLTAEGHFHDPDTLRERFEAVGWRDDLAFGVSCGSGVSAAHNIAALASIGASAALYVGSWSAWSADKERPIAYGEEVRTTES